MPAYNSALLKCQLNSVKDVKNVITKVHNLNKLSNILDKEVVSFKNEVDKWRI